jgi:hypothetical protein
MADCVFFVFFNSANVQNKTKINEDFIVNKKHILLIEY